jgi:hypothetical protein
MSRTVCLWARTLSYPTGGGHLWVYLNWALGAIACGCEVIWLESFPAALEAEVILDWVHALKQNLEGYGLAEKIALCSDTGAPLPTALAGSVLDEHAVQDADVLLNMSYYGFERILAQCRRSAFIDIDPGLTQIWIANRQLVLPPHDSYFTTGETVGAFGTRFSDCGLLWQYTPPCVALDFWPICSAPAGGAYTTISHWDGSEWVLDGGDQYDNNKRMGFLPYLELPRGVDVRLELALSLGGDERERASLENNNWVVREAASVAGTPLKYQNYIQGSRGEFSCVKPSCVRLQNAWISDRTLCYLASGKPAVVEHTGPSRFLPDADGLLRFRSFKEARSRLHEAELKYDHHARAARALCEQHFDARRVVGRVLERAL